MIEKMFLVVQKDEKMDSKIKGSENDKKRCGNETGVYLRIKVVNVC